ncbi:MAG: hypothetical protein VX589_01080 [Myxococcota bacterium]|nr:hypothetical protein [Myxococcota bacterium]
MSLLDRPFLGALTIFMCIGGLVAVPETGQCEVRPSDISIPTNEQGLGPGYGRRTTQFQFDLGVFFGSEKRDANDVERSAVLPTLGVVQPVGRNEAELSLSVLRYGSTTTEMDDELSASTFRFSNPELKYFFVWRNLERQVRIGLGMTVPLARLRNEQEEQLAVDYDAMASALKMNGMRDRWQWSFDTMATLFSVDYVGRFPSGFIFGAGVIIAPMFNVGDSLGSYAEQGFVAPLDYTFIGQGDFELAFDAEHVRSSLKVSYSTDTSAKAAEAGKNQLVIEPNFRIRFTGVDALIGLSLPKDSLTGSPFADGKFWMLTIGIATSTNLVLPQ